MSENLFKQANKLFFAKRYQEALQLYELGAQKYGRDLVHLNILLCKKYLSHVADYDYVQDPVTRRLLSNAGEIKISELENKSLIDSVKELQKSKSEDVIVESIKPIPNDWPDGLNLSALPESTNDFDYA